jgi:hypothetical protein
MQMRANSGERAESVAEDPDAQGFFFLRVAAIWASATLPIARIVAPGLRGTANDATVVVWQRIAATASYALALLFFAVAIESSAQLLRKEHALRGLRGLVVAGTLVTMALSAPAFARRLPAQPATVLVLSASVVVVVAAVRALAIARTRAVGLVLAVFGVAALLRLFGWQLAVAAGEQVNSRLYDVSRAIASVGVVLEAVGQLAAVAWLGTRRRIWGQLLTSAAILAGFGITWGATLGIHHDATVWQSVLHTALLEAPGVPSPFGLSAVATFLFAASFPLAIVATVQRGEDARAGWALALILISHGAFDAPLRALAAVSAAVALIAADNGTRRA